MVDELYWFPFNCKGVPNKVDTLFISVDSLNRSALEVGLGDNAKSKSRLIDLFASIVINDQLQTVVTVEVVNLGFDYFQINCQALT